MYNRRLLLHAVGPLRCPFAALLLRAGVGQMAFSSTNVARPLVPGDSGLGARHLQMVWRAAIVALHRLALAFVPLALALSLALSNVA